MRQAELSSAPSATNTAMKAGIASCVTPPPRLPQPAEKALAVPTMRGAKSREVQAWHGTNAPPTTPMAARMTSKYVGPLVNAPSVTGTAP